MTQVLHACVRPYSLNFRSTIDSCSQSPCSSGSDIENRRLKGHKLFPLIQCDVWRVFSPSQNTRDLKTDIRAGYRTLAVLVGPQRACYFHTLFMLFPYVIVGLQAATTSLYFGLTLLTLPFAFNLSVACFEGKHFTLPQKIAVLYASFGILYVFSMYLS